MTRPTIPCVFVLLAFAGCASRGQETGGPTNGGHADAAWRTSFEDVAPGALPEGWEAVETNGAGDPAHWEVLPSDQAADGAQVLAVRTANHGQTYNVLLAAEARPADLVLSVHLRARTGAEDQGGGLVWRARGPDDYLVARWNPLEDNLRLYTVERGVRTQLASASVHVDPEAWHELIVRAVGDLHVVAFDGAELLRQRAAWPGGGRVGLWTKADASTWFDVLAVSAPR